MITATLPTNCMRLTCVSDRRTSAEILRPTVPAPHGVPNDCSELGASYAVKLCLNLLFFIHVAAGAEVLTLGTKAGVDLDVLHRLLVGSGGSRRFLERDMLSVFQGDYRQYFRPALACKDLSLAVDLGRKNGVPLQVSALVEQIHRRALAQYGDAGQLFAVRLLEDPTQISLRA